MIVLLLVTQNEAELLAWNLRHHLEWGIDHIAVADNRSEDATRDVVREFGAAVSYRRFKDFHVRQIVRHEMMLAVQEKHRVEWAGIADTDEFFWTPNTSIRDLLGETPPDIVAVNFDAKLFLPTELDRSDGPVFLRRMYRTARDDTPLHTSYREGKSFYRASWLGSLPSRHNCGAHEHWCRLVPHPRYRPKAHAVHHYMIQDEDQFARKVMRLIEWVQAPSGVLQRRAWKKTPSRQRDLPKSMAPFKRQWWKVYQQGGEEAVRDYYRNTYTLNAERVREALASGELVGDDDFLQWAEGRYHPTVRLPRKPSSATPMNDPED